MISRDSARLTVPQVLRGYRLSAVIKTRETYRNACKKNPNYVFFVTVIVISIFFGVIKLVLAVTALV